MGILDKLKFKKPEDKPGSQNKTAEDNVLDLVKEGQPAKEKKPVVLKSATGDAYRILLHPQFSEKSNLLSNKGKYVFIVDPSANKTEIKKAVEKVYDVHVTDVNVLRVAGKKRRYGRSVGQTRSWKKAVVTLLAGEKIEGISQVI